MVAGARHLLTAHSFPERGRQGLAGRVLRRGATLRSPGNGLSA